MFTSVIRMAIMRTGRTGRGSDHLQASNLLLVSSPLPESGLQQVSNLLPVSGLQQVSNHALNRARYKTINVNNWTGLIRIGTRGLKTTIGHNSTSNKTEAGRVGQAGQVGADQVVPGPPVAGEDNS